MNPQRVVIIGGGVIGCGIAWRLAQRGAQVMVLEKEMQPGTKASWAAAGMLLPILESDSPLRPLAAASFAEYPQFVAELHDTTGIDAGLIIEGPHSGSIDNRKLTSALYHAAAQAGAEFRFGVTARKVVSNGGRFQLVEVVDKTPIHADAVVIAAGAWAGELLGLPIRLPVVPVRGQMLAVEHVPSIVTEIIEGERCYLVPRGDRLLVGATVERVGFDESTTDSAIGDLMSAARELEPRVGDAQIVEVWAGLRPGTPDDLPILGADPRIAGVYYATGHYRNGILLTPITARLMTELIVEGKSSADLADFSVERFVVDVGEPRCDLCGAPMKEWHCRIICTGCGYQRDCSDP